MAAGKRRSASIVGAGRVTTLSIGDCPSGERRATCRRPGGRQQVEKRARTLFKRLQAPFQANWIALMRPSLILSRERVRRRREYKGLPVAGGGARRRDERKPL